MIDEKLHTNVPQDDNDPRSDLEQMVQARSDAVARGEGGTPSPLDSTVSEDAAGGAGGRVKNQEENQQ
jgi:hypothetical protein